ncbi:Protein of unknown function, partial [Cotesia congregata]
CTDNVLLLQLTLQLQFRFSDTTAYILFIDFRRAFDYVLQDKLYMNTKYIRFFKSFYDKVVVCIKKDSQYSEPIEITAGVLKGEILSS